MTVMGRRRRWSLPASIAVALAVAIVIAASGPGGTSDGASVYAEDGPGYVSELFAETPDDKARHTLCLLDGQYGQVIQNGTVYNRNSHVDYHWYAADALTVGIQGGDVGAIVDLGARDEVAARFGGRSPFEGLRWKEGSLRAGEDIVPTTHPMVRDLPKSTPARVGHLYLIRLTAKSGMAPFEIVVLLEVLEHNPGRRVKFHWNLL